MEYANQTIGGAASAQRAIRADEKPLDSIATATQRVNSAIVRLNDFIERFHGPQPEVQSGSTTPESMPCHGGNLNRLSGALDRLEVAVDGVSRIG